MYAEEYLTHYYTLGCEPFRSLSALPDEVALPLMADLYERFRGSILYERFRDPVGYLADRRRTEGWVRDAFIAKGGEPLEPYPVTMVFRESPWIVHHSPDRSLHAEVRIPLSRFAEGDVSFTFPDSMVSHWLGTEKPAPYYIEELHGIVFTRTEVVSLVRERGLPELEWNVLLPENVGAYIEAQVWNQGPLRLVAAEIARSAGA